MFVLCFSSRKDQCVNVGLRYVFEKTEIEIPDWNRGLLRIERNKDWNRSLLHSERNKNSMLLSCKTIVFMLIHLPFLPCFLNPQPTYQHYHFVLVRMQPVSPSLQSSIRHPDKLLLLLSPNLTTSPTVLTNAASQPSRYLPSMPPSRSRTTAFSPFAKDRTLACIASSCRYSGIEGRIEEKACSASKLVGDCIPSISRALGGTCARLSMESGCDATA